MHKKGIRSRWLHDYIPNSLLPNARKASGFLKLLNRTSEKREIHATVDSFLSMAVILRTLRDWILLSCCALRLSKLPILSSEYLSPLFVKDLRESFFGVSSIRNLLHLNLFEDAMRSLPRQKIGFYLQENQPWETALIYSWRQAGHGKIVGIPHSTVRFWDLRYFTDQRSFREPEETKMPRPDIVAVNGNFMKTQFLKSNYPKNEIEEVEALRYLQLRKNNAFKKNSRSKTQIIRLLVLGDYLENDTKKMLNCLNEAVLQVKKNLLITFKGHPACSINLKANLIFPAKITDDPIVRLAKTHDLVFTSPVTSAAVEAYCSGLCVLTFLDSESLNLSPLRETHNFISIVNSSSLAQKINQFTTNKGKKIKFFYQNKNLVKWEKLLKKQK
jgi:surface carbohydrate biosynthesis protein (TIGR04326 family)